MPSQRGPSVWESEDGELGLRRSVESLEGAEFLVQLEFTNTHGRAVSGRVIDDLPPAVDEVTIVVAPGGDPSACRRVEERIVHEPRIPANAQRKAAYVLKTEAESSLQLPPPRVRRVKPVDGPTETEGNEEAGGVIQTEGTASIREAAAVSELGAEPADSSEVEGPAAGSADALLDRLLAALEDDDYEEKRRQIRAAVGLAPSERARLDYLQTRLDDLAAYVDVLEILIDDHGIDVIGELKAATERNEDRTESIADALEALEGDVERYRADADREILAIHTELEQLDDEIGDRFGDLERTIDRIGQDVETLRDGRRKDRQALARQLWDLEQSVASLSETVTELEASIEESEEFRERFAAVLGSEP